MLICLFCRYTYGEPVRGALQASFCIKSGTWYGRSVHRPCAQINVTEVRVGYLFNNLNQSVLKYSKLQVHNARKEDFPVQYNILLIRFMKYLFRLKISHFSIISCYFRFHFVSVRRLPCIQCFRLGSPSDQQII